MEIRQEELSDLPLLAQMIQETGLSDLLDKHYPVHGNWRAPSFGKMLTGWLMYIISECDHRLYTVEDWASRHLGVLRGALDCPAFEGSSFQDDRLGKMLERLSDIPRYEAFMGEYTGSLLRLYELPQTVVRVDSFNAPSYRDAVPGGLFQHGYHKSHQPDEPQVKVMAACLDPLAFPVAALSVAGSASDDELYAPVIEQARRVLSPRGLLYVGDVKMGTAATFSLLAGSGNFYLCPLSNAALPKGALLEGIEAARRPGKGNCAAFTERPPGARTRARWPGCAKKSAPPKRSCWSVSCPKSRANSGKGRIWPRPSWTRCWTKTAKPSNSGRKHSPTWCRQQKQKSQTTDRRTAAQTFQGCLRRLGQTRRWGHFGDSLAFRPHSRHHP